MMYDVIIAGAGPAGVTAAIYAARAGMSAVTLERMFAGGQAATTSEIMNYPGFANGINGADFAMALSDQAANCGAQIVTGDITAFELSGGVKRVVTDGETYEAKNVILAMGAAPAALGLPGEAALRGAGVSYCATCDGAFFRGRDVCVVGGGNTAGEDALYLANICKTVYIIHRRSEYRMQQSLQDEIAKRENIVPVLSSQPTRILGDAAVTGIEVETAGEKRELSVSAVFIAVGITPNTSLVPDELKNERGFIVTDADMKTAIPGVYAAGDIREKKLRQIVTATADGAVAISSILER